MLIVNQYITQYNIRSLNCSVIYHQITYKAFDWIILYATVIGDIWYYVWLFIKIHAIYRIHLDKIILIGNILIITVKKHCYLCFIN